MFAFSRRFVAAPIVLALAVAACSDDGESSDGSGGSAGTGGSAGAAMGGAAGSASGGTAGSGTGGAAGSTGGTAGSSGGSAGTAGVNDYGALGPYAVGNARTSLLDRTGQRNLPVEIWYPAVESARAAATTGQPLAAFEQGTAHEAEMAQLVSSSDATCIRSTTRSAAAPAALAGGSLPAVVFSHCHECMRFDVAEVAERIASYGIVVAAPDHLDNTAWDHTASLGAAFLDVRVSDISSVLDRLLDATATEVPADLRGRIDASHIGVMGHSFGAVTTGKVVVTDSRFKAALAIAAPLNIYGGAQPASVTVPYLFLLAQQDDSIGAAGNLLLRNDYAAVAGPAWLVEVEAAGHWSFSDIAGLGGRFGAGCGAQYIDNAEARALAASIAAGFFAQELQGRSDFATYLSGLPAPAHVSSHP